MSQQNKGILYLIPTPLSDSDLEMVITPFLVNTISNLDHFLVENIRTARRFISSLNTPLVIEDLIFEVLDKNTDVSSIPQLCHPLLNGVNMGVLSEAGCPGIADPGSMAVDFAHQNEIKVVPLVGPSSIFMSLMASGFNGQSFTFHGYLPIDKNNRGRMIKMLEKNAIQFRQTQIFMETPYRNNSLVDDLLKFCLPETRLCIARDISGKQEMIRTMKIKDWKKNKPDLRKIPTVFLIYSE